MYLADRRYDMLPSVRVPSLLIVCSALQMLSANICSLLGDVDRYALSVFWELDAGMNVVKAWFGRTVIRSEYKVPITALLPHAHTDHLAAAL